MPLHLSLSVTHLETTQWVATGMLETCLEMLLIKFPVPIRLLIMYVKVINGDLGQQDFVFWFILFHLDCHSPVIDRPSGCPGL